MIEYLVVIEPAEDGSGFGAYVPDLPGCVAAGRTAAEAKERIAFSIPLQYCLPARPWRAGSASSGAS